VFDAVYTPKETQLLKDAKEVGAVTVSGEEMFYRQAFAQFKLFTGLSRKHQHAIICMLPAVVILYYCPTRGWWYPGGQQHDFILKYAPLFFLAI